MVEEVELFVLLNIVLTFLKVWHPLYVIFYKIKNYQLTKQSTGYLPSGNTQRRKSCFGLDVFFYYFCKSSGSQLGAGVIREYCPGGHEHKTGGGK